MALRAGLIFYSKIYTILGMVKKKFQLIIFGCQMNYSDAERLSSVLQKLGYQETQNENEADLIAIIACSVRQAAVDRIYGKLRNWQIVKEKRPLITLLSGCVLPRDQKKLKDKFDLFIDIKNLHNLAKELKNIAPEKKLALPDFFDISPSYKSSYRAYVPIMTGCNKFCSYCAVPYTRGREVSRPAKDILKEIKGLLKNGYKEIILLAQYSDCTQQYCHRHQSEFLSLLHLLVPAARLLSRCLRMGYSLYNPRELMRKRCRS